jgi:hypothetical protein
MTHQLFSSQDAAGRVPGEQDRRCRWKARVRARRLAADTAKLAHDVRTPLAVIQEYAALMREGLVGTLNDEQQRVLDVIADRACDLNRVVDNAVDASRLAVKSHNFCRGRCRIGDIVGRIRPQLLRKARVREVDLLFEAAATVPNVYCDGDVVGRALANIITAALNASRDDCQMSIREALHPSRKEAGVQINVTGTDQDEVGDQFRNMTQQAASQRGRRVSRTCEGSLAVELIKGNLGSVDRTTTGGGAASLWIGFPIVDPLEVLRRHLTRTLERHPRCQQVSLLCATACEPIDGGLARDLVSALNCQVGRHGLVVDLDGTRWLLAIADERRAAEYWVRRLERAQERITAQRLGRPLPQLSLEALGSWQLSNGLERILASVERQSRSGVPALAGAE